MTDQNLTWNRILMTSSGEVTVRDIPPEIAPAVASMNARFSCPGSSITKTLAYVRPESIHHLKSTRQYEESPITTP